jgi:hypothetical protein
VQTVIILIGGMICFGLLSYFNKNRNLESSRQSEEEIAGLS